MDVQTGMMLPCPCCEEEQACVSLLLDCGAFVCRECDEEISAEAVQEMITQAEERLAQVRRWEGVLRWAKQMPTAEA